MILSGLDHARTNSELKAKLKKKRLGLLCHSASVDRHYTHTAEIFMADPDLNLVKLFGPQHGFVTDVQDNMVESNHYTHPYFKLPVYSLYSETRAPTSEMLDGLDALVIDLQDVGTRIYTYIYTMTLALEACAKKGIELIVLDRPNPINGIQIEGNVLESGWESFVGRHPLPVRHGLTMGEVALWAQKFCNISGHFSGKLTVIPMRNWKRHMSFEETHLPWVLPSPNLPTIEAAYTFVGSVLLEGTNLSEGRGTTRALEVIGHPDIEPFGFYHHQLHPKLKTEKLYGFVLRPCLFAPTFQKHAGKTVGGFQVHVIDRKIFQPWRLFQFLIREFAAHLGPKFQWKQPPYEYEHHRMPIDLINGTDELRKWVEKQGAMEELDHIENKSIEKFKQQAKEIWLYNE